MIFWLLYITLCILYNYTKIEVWKKRPDYLSAEIWRVFFGGVVLIVSNPFIDPAYPITLLPALPFAAFQVSSFYLLFDPILNLLRGKKWNYRGENSGYLDSSPLWVYYGLKIISLIGFISSIIILLQ